MIKIPRKGWLFLLFSIVIVLAACSGSRVAVKDKRLKKLTAEKLISALNAHYIEADWLSAKTRVAVKSEMGNIRFTSYLRMRTDSLIWFNMKKLGIEVSRGLITPDSFFLIDRLNRVYVKDAIEVIEEEYQLPFTFERLQKFILGNPDRITPEMEVNLAGNQYQLVSDTLGERHELFVEPDQFLLKRQIMHDQMRDQELSSDYLSYTDIDQERTFSLERNVVIEMKGTSEVLVQVTFDDVQFNVPKSTPFHIPDQYIRVFP